jgi:hypothetical protein
MESALHFSTYVYTRIYLFQNALLSNIHSFQFWYSFVAAVRAYVTDLFFSNPDFDELFWQQEANVFKNVWLHSLHDTFCTKRILSP